MRMGVRIVAVVATAVMAETEFQDLTQISQGWNIFIDRCQACGGKSRFDLHIDLFNDRVPLAGG